VLKKLLKVTALSSCLLYAHSGFAADRPVLELMELTGMEQANENVIEQSMEQVDSMLDQILPNVGDENPDVQAAMQRYKDGSSELIASSMDWKKIGPKTAAVMESVYTDDEIMQLIAFYKTELGQMLRAKQPQMTQELMVLQGEEMQRMGIGIQQLAQQLMHDLQNIQ